MLKQQLEAIVQENSLLKRAVVTQQKRQRETEDQSLELQHLRQLVTQYQEQLRTLEVCITVLTVAYTIVSVFLSIINMIKSKYCIDYSLQVNNYALTLHLKQAQQNSSIPGRYHPDVF